MLSEAKLEEVEKLLGDEAVALGLSVRRHTRAFRGSVNRVGSDEPQELFTWVARHPSEHGGHAGEAMRSNMSLSETCIERDAAAAVRSELKMAAALMLDEYRRLMPKPAA